MCFKPNSSLKLSVFLTSFFTQIYFYDVFRADGHEVPHIRFMQPPGSSNITCLAFAASGLYFCIGCADGQVSVIDTSSVNPSIDADSNAAHACFLKTPGVSLNCITALSFGGLDKDDDRVIVGDRSGQVHSCVFEFFLYSRL